MSRSLKQFAGHHMMRIYVLFFLTALLSSTLSRADDRHVVIITMDGFAAYLLADPRAPIPTLRKLAAAGTTAEGMHVVNPSVTWPNHTTLVTGVSPAKHGVIFNGVLVRGEAGTPVKVDPARDQSELVAVPTLWDLAHQAGLTTAAINWPCSRNSAALDDNFPDVSDQVKFMTPRLRDELLQAGILPTADPKEWKKMSGAQFDQIWTGATCYVIKHRKPNLLLFHMLLMDSIHHQYGPQTTAGYAAASVLDSQLRDVLQALDDAGIRDKTTIFLVSDHGFAAAKKLIEPNAMLRKAALLHATATGISEARVQAITEGGTAFIYFTDPAAGPDLRDKVIHLFAGKEGISEVITRDHFAALGLPMPEQNHHMANLILGAEEGYAFAAAATGDDDIRPAVIGVSTVGNHGYLSSNPKMNALFIAGGRGIRKGTIHVTIDNTSVAPTAGRLLGLEIPGVDGKVLSEVLAE